MYVCTSTVDAFSHVREINIKRNYCIHTTHYTVHSNTGCTCTLHLYTWLHMMQWAEESRYERIKEDQK